MRIAIFGTAYFFPLTGRLMLSLAGVILSVNLAAQNSYRGTVRDAESGESLVFVSLQLTSTETGTYTDLDGGFILQARPGDTLRVRYLGYAERLVVLTSDPELTILLEARSVGLQEVVVRPGENPAWRIIRRTLAQRDRHDPKRKPGYRYTGYHKAILTIDTVRTAPRPSTDHQTTRRDTSHQREDSPRTRRQNLFLNEMHLWVTETVSEHAYRTPSHHQETVIATQSSLPNDVTGGVNPINFQPFGFYQEVIRMEMTDQNYVNPISRGSFRRYAFTLADSIVRAEDTTYVIEFAPRPGKFFTALRGVLYINTDGYAIERVIAMPADTSQTLQFTLQQESARVDGNWFPKTLQADIFFRMGMADLTIAYGFRNRSVLSDVDLRPPPARAFNHYAKDGEAAARIVSDTLRQLPLSARERNTYTYWDSLPELRSAYRLLSAYGPLAQAFAGGLLPGKYVDLVLPDVLRFNAREGTRFGLGLRTSPATWAGGTLYAYAGYGLMDRRWKYGGAVEKMLYRKRAVKLRLDYHRDLAIPGDVDYLSSVDNPWSNWNARYLILDRFDERQSERIDLFYRPRGAWRLNVFGRRELRTLPYAYAFGEAPIAEGRRYRAAAAGLRVRWAPRERLVKMGRLETVLFPVFPVVEVVATRLVTDGTAAQRVSAQLRHEVRWRYLGASAFNVQAGHLSTSLPYPFLFQAPGNGDNGVSGSGLFNTAGLTEFAQERYVYLFFEHRFGTVLGRVRNPRFRPEPRLMHHVGWGELSSVRQAGITIRDMRHGYHESGIGLDNMLRISYFKALYLGLGVNAWYRWGAYRLPVWRDNVRVQLTLKMSV